VGDGAKRAGRALSAWEKLGGPRAAGTAPAWSRAERISGTGLRRDRLRARRPALATVDERGVSGPEPLATA
jgi:hypothetical protein